MFSNFSRNHPSIIIERLFASIGVMFFIVFSNVASDNPVNMVSISFWKDFFSQVLKGNLTVFLSGAGIVLLIVVVVLVSFLIWRKTFFYIDGDVLIVERRTIFKKFSKLPAANISTVNLERNIFEKLIGTSKVKIDINSSTTAAKTDFIFVLKAPVAEQFKSCLLEIKNGNLSQEYVSQTKSSESKKVVFLSFWEVVRHKILSVPVIQIIVGIFVFIVPLFDQEDMQNTDDVFRLIVLAVIGYALSLIIGVLNLARFQVLIDDINIYIKCGLLKNKSYAFEHNKINAVIIRQSFLARIFRLYSVEVAVIGLGNEKNEVSVLSLLINKGKMQNVLNMCAKEFKTDGKVIPSAKQALIPYFFRASIITIISFATLFLPFYNTWITPIVVAFISFLGGYLAYRTKLISYDDKIFKCVSGIFSKKTALFKYSDLQLVKIKTNFILKKFNVGKATVRILSSTALSLHQTGYFDISHFDKISDYTVLAPDKLSIKWGLIDR